MMENWPREYPSEHDGWLLLMDAVTHPRPLCNGEHDACRHLVAGTKPRDPRTFAERVAARLSGEDRRRYLQWLGR